MFNVARVICTVDWTGFIKITAEATQSSLNNRYNIDVNHCYPQNLLEKK